MNLTLLLLDSGQEPKASVVADAARKVFPAVNLREIQTLKEASACAPPGTSEFVVLINPRREDLQAALAAEDETGLPRWPVAVLGTLEEDDGLALPREEWSPRAVARHLRLALANHTLRRENARARGDLQTLGQRFTHDLRAHLGGVLCVSEALREALAEGGLAKPSQLEPIIDSATETGRLLERISFVTRASTANKPQENLDMGLAFWAALQRVEVQMIQRRAVLDQPSSWPRVTGILPWLEVVWSNLLENALQHAGQNCQPHLTAGWDAAAPELRFWLKDNGPGVSSDKRASLFHPLHRLHETHAPNGFGLPITQRLVQLQGGRCGYHSLPEGGSCFYFTLPNGSPTR